MIDKIVNKISNCNKVAILGYGREGKSTYKFIRKYLSNKELTIIDINNVIETNSELVNDKNLNIVYGDNYLDNLEQYDLIIKTPGISFKDIDVSNIRNKITSQIELLLEVNKKNIIGITGTKGKSTTSSLIYKILKDQNIDTYLIGNIGVPVLDEIEKYNENTILVIEMSSHQLEFVKNSPHIGLILNLFQDHLDHAGSVANYHNSKMNMIKYQTNEDYGIVDIDNEYLKNILSNRIYDTNLLKVSIKEETNIYLKNSEIYLNNNLLINEKEIKRNIEGIHNLKNIMFVLLIVDILKLDFGKAIQSISEFQPLEHRMEYVGTYKNIKFYDDVIATIPEATINAIETLKEVDTLIFGGQDRKIDYSKLIDYLKKSNINNFICMPTTGTEIGKQIDNEKHNIYYVATLEEAVELAYKVTNKICLLSPSAPSYEFFKNFEEKGKRYKELIVELGK